MDISVKETEGPVKTTGIMSGSNNVYMSKAVTSEVQHRDLINFPKLSRSQ